MPLDLKRALVVSKTTRYEDEARIYAGKSVPELSKEDMVEVDKGFSIDALKHSHESQTHSLGLIIQSLNEKGIEFDVTTSGESFTGENDKEGAKEHSKYDLIISAGGDGTFLRAALNNDGSTPQVGINTDPSRSRGQLCVDFAHNLSRQLDRLKAGNYTWVRRSRIKTTRVYVDGRGGGGSLEQFALNEVFVGERDPVRASVLKVQSDGEEWERHKCSGLLISTGTGTSAWSAEASKVNPQDVMAVLRGIEKVYQGIKLGDVLADGFDAGAVASAANQATASERLAHDAEELQLLVREPILTAGAIDRGICIWQGAKPSKARLLRDGEIFGEYHPMRSIARQVKVSSIGCDVHLVLDGRTWVEVERGVEVHFEIAHQNPLWTFSFD